MVALYALGIGYGVGTGIWLDSLFSITDPGLAIIFPAALGVAAPVGAFLWDRNTNPPRGLPSSIALGLGLGAVEGLAISGVHWQYTGNGPIDKTAFRTYTTVTFLAATGGGIGGYFFGEFARPNPKGLSFVGSGAAWGTITGTLFGIGVSGRDWKDGASVAGLIGYNVGVVGTGLTSLAWTPSFNTQGAMWIGYVVGAGVGALVFPFYLFCDDCETKRGFIAVSVGSLAGLSLATLFVGSNDRGTSATRSPLAQIGMKPPFELAMTPAPRAPTLPWGKDPGTGGNVLTLTRRF
jgi:hypothetical protein